MGRYFIDITGHVFGRLTVIERNGISREGQAAWRCLCECGTTKTIAGYSLRRGDSASCGHPRHRNPRKTHGLSGTNIYDVWRGIKKRCENKTNKNYHNYGGRGISLCERWHSFAAFHEDMGPRPNGYTLDRINNNGNYEPGNCRWTTWAVQAQNKRCAHWIAYNGETKSLTEWSKELSIPISTLNERLRRGWSIEKTIRVPLRKTKRKGDGFITYEGQTKKVAVWAEKFQIGASALRERLRKGWPVSVALTAPKSSRLEDAVPAPRPS